MSESKKKIIYVWKSPYPWDVRVQKICESLAKKYDVMILARWGGEEAEEEIINNITIRRIGYKKASFLSTPLSINPIWKKEIKKAIKDFSANLLIVREIMLGTATGKIGKDFNIPVIMDMAENYPAAMKLWKKYNTNFISKLLVHKLNTPENIEKNSIELMQGIITVCRENSIRLNKLYNYNYKLTTVIYNTPKLNWLSENKAVKSKKIVFVHHGWLTAEKRIDNFLIKFIDLFGNNDNYEFIIAGDGDCRKDYEYISKDVDNVKFTGEYSLNQLKQILDNADMGVLPTEENEFNNYTIHNKIFDYLSFGIPVIVSENQPSAKIVKEYNAGYLINYNSKNALEKLESIKEGELEKMSANAKKAFKEKYNWEVDEKNLFDFISGYLK